MVRYFTPKNIATWAKNIIPYAMRITTIREYDKVRKYFKLLVFIWLLESQMHNAEENFKIQFAENFSNSFDIIRIHSTSIFPRNTAGKIFATAVHTTASFQAFLASLTLRAYAARFPKITPTFRIATYRRDDKSSPRHSNTPISNTHTAPNPKINFFPDDPYTSARVPSGKLKYRRRALRVTGVHTITYYNAIQHPPSLFRPLRAHQGSHMALSLALFPARSSNSATCTDVHTRRRLSATPDAFGFPRGKLRTRRAPLPPSPPPARSNKFPDARNITRRALASGRA